MDDNLDNLSLLETEEVKPHIMQITLNNPKALNSLNKTMLEELNLVLDEVINNKSIKALLITGSEKSFSAGADIKALLNLNSNDAYKFAKFGQNVFNKLENLGKPSLAVISGYCFGGGLELALSATLRTASNNAQFGLPEIKLGIIPAYGGTQRLSRLIGKGNALYLCLTGKFIDTQDARSYGLINEMFPANQLIENSLKILEEIVKFSSCSAHGIIEAINHGCNLPIKQALELEANIFARACSTEDKHEGVLAFLEKREPHFIDK